MAPWAVDYRTMPMHAADSAPQAAGCGLSLGMRAALTFRMPGFTSSRKPASSKSYTEQGFKALELGLEAYANTPAEIAKAVKDENAAWAPFVKRVGFTPEA